MGFQSSGKRLCAYRWSNDWRITFAGPTDWCSHHLGPVLGDVVKALKLQSGFGIRERLLNAAGQRQALKTAFLEALDSDRWNHVLPEHVVYPPSDFPLRLHMHSPINRNGYVIDIAAPEMLSTLRLALSGESTDDRSHEDAAGLASQLLEAGQLEEMTTMENNFEMEGIYRLQHAGALIVSKRAKVLIDPVSQIDPNWGIRPECLSAIDAVLISHSHKDHFCLGTLLSFPRDTLMIVPRVNRTSMLCPNMAAILRAAGFSRVVDADWWTDIQVEDQTIQIMPFYGEQPWLHVAAPNQDLRSHGNTYLIDFGPAKAWFLVDSGQEFGASMMDTAAKARNMFGPIDIVLSNLRDFPWHPAQIDGSGRYLLCFTKEHLFDTRRWLRNGARMTLGVDGVAEFLGLVAARFFLPYAHWFNEPDIPVKIDGAPEIQALERLRDACSRHGNTETAIVSWKILDGFVPRPKGWDVHSAGNK